MSEREDYPPGVPCWVETFQPDPRAATAFYRELFGWTFASARQPRGKTDYYVAQLRDRDVAGIGPVLTGLDGAPCWIKHIRVASAAHRAKIARAAGGTVLIELFELPTGGRMAVLADPAGAAFAISDADAGPGARLVNEAQAWALSTLYTPDPEASEHFYGTVFGWKTEAVGSSGFRIFRLDGYVGGVPYQPVPRDVVAVMQPLAGAAEGPRWEIDFWVDDVDQTAAHAAVLGGTVMMAPQDTGLFRYAMIADPQGAMFTVSKMTVR